MQVAAGFYTLRDKVTKDLTVCQVIEGDDEVYVLGYCYLWVRADVFNDRNEGWFDVLAGPYPLRES